LLALAAFWLARSAPQVPDRPLVRLEVELVSAGQLANVVGTKFAVSPDGTRLVFAAAGPNGGSNLYTRRLDLSEVTAIPGSEGGRVPVFSPDGHWIAFWSAGKLKKAPVDGGSPIVLCEASDLLGASWGEDDNIIAELRSDGKLWRVPASGGSPVAIVDSGQAPARLLWPQVLPGARAVIFSRMSASPDLGSIEALSLKDGQCKTLVRRGTFGRYVPGGRLLYVNQGNLYAQAFNLKRLETVGPAVVVLSNIEYSPVFGFAQLDFSQTGVLVYRRTTGNGLFVIDWVDREGKTESLVDTPGPYLWPRVSPDGKRVAITRTESGDSRIWIVDHPGRTLTPLTSAPGIRTNPVWSVDGRFLIMSGDRTIEWVPVDGSKPPQILLKGGMPQFPWSLSPDGHRLAFYALDPETHFDLWTAPLEIRSGELRAGTPQAFLRTKDVETYPTFSPDGKWIAYVALRAGKYEVYVRAFPDNGIEVQASKGGGRHPVWARSGKQLIFATEDQRVMVASYRITNGSFEVDQPKLWSSVRLGDTGVLANFDLAPDGRIVALLSPTSLERQPPNHVTFLMNFFDEVSRRLSTGPR